MAKYAAKEFLLPLDYCKNEMSMEEFRDMEDLMLQSDDFENAYMIDSKPKETVKTPPQV